MFHQYDNRQGNIDVKIVMTPSLNNNKQQVVEDDREGQWIFYLYFVEINNNHAIFSNFGSGSIHFLHRDFKSIFIEELSCEPNQNEYQN